jgi:hypothetical protein
VVGVMIRGEVKVGARDQLRIGLIGRIRIKVRVMDSTMNLTLPSFMQCISKLTLSIPYVG